MRYVCCHSLYHSLSLAVICCTTCCCSLYQSMSLVVAFVVTQCHSLSLVVPLVVIRCQLLYHSLLFVVNCCTTCRLSLSFIITRCTTRCHSLSLIVSLVRLFINNRIWRNICKFVKADLHSVNVSRATVRQDLWAITVSVVAQNHVFLLYLHNWKKVQLVWTFLQLLANDDVK